MSGKATNSRSRGEVRQRPPERCARCGKRLGRGAGRYVAGVGVVCHRCETRQDAEQPHAR